jgi:hypothetical protein
VQSEEVSRREVLRATRRSRGHYRKLTRCFVWFLRLCSAEARPPDCQRLVIDDSQAVLSGRWCSYVAITGLLHPHRWNKSPSGTPCAGAGQMQRFARRTTPATESRILKLKGLPYATKEGDLQAFFQNFKLLRVALVSEPDGRPSGLVSVASLASYSTPAPTQTGETTRHVQHWAVLCNSGVCRV